MDALEQTNGAEIPVAIYTSFVARYRRKKQWTAHKHTYTPHLKTSASEWIPRTESVINLSSEFTNFRFQFIVLMCILFHIQYYFILVFRYGLGWVLG